MKNIIDKDVLLKDVEKIARLARKEYEKQNPPFSSKNISHYDREIINGLRNMQKHFMRSLLNNDFVDDPSSPEWFKSQEKDWINASYEDKVNSLQISLEQIGAISASCNFAEQVIINAKSKLSNVIKNENELNKLFDEVINEDKDLFDKRLIVLTYFYLIEKQSFDEKKTDFLNLTEDIFTNYHTNDLRGRLPDNWESSWIRNWHNSKDQFLSCWSKVFDDFLLGKNIEKSLKFKNKQVVQSILSDSVYSFLTRDERSKSKEVFENNFLSYKEVLSLVNEADINKLNHFIEKLNIKDIVSNPASFKNKKIDSNQDKVNDEYKFDEVSLKSSKDNLLAKNNNKNTFYKLKK